MTERYIRMDKLVEKVKSQPPQKTSCEDAIKLRSQMRDVIRGYKG